MTWRALRTTAITRRPQALDQSLQRKAIGRKPTFRAEIFKHRATWPGRVRIIEGADYSGNDQNAGVIEKALADLAQ